MKSDDKMRIYSSHCLVHVARHMQVEKGDKWPWEESESDIQGYSKPLCDWIRDQAQCISSSGDIALLSSLKSGVVW
jgi:hypothetical protein